MKIIPCSIFGVFLKFGEIAENDSIINFSKFLENFKDNTGKSSNSLYLTKCKLFNHKIIALAVYQFFRKIPNVNL